MTTVTLKKWGNSPSIRIPASVMRAAALNIEDKLDLKIDEAGQIILVPLRSKEYSLDMLLSGITPENIHQKINFGSPAGKELI